MSFPPTSLKSLVQEVATQLIRRGETLALVETACGGLISSSLLSIPGSSKFYRGGVTLYTLESRVAFAGWTQVDIDRYRGPTPGIVEGIARHVRDTLKADHCLCESGTAGPTGGNTPNRTPGYCAIALATESTVESIEINTASAERSDNQIAFAHAALKLLLDKLQLNREGKI